MPASSISISNGRVELWGTDYDDNIRTYDYSGSQIRFGSLDPWGSYWGYKGYSANGGAGNDVLSATVIGNRTSGRHDALFGNQGDDLMTASASDSSLVSFTANGGPGWDEFYVMDVDVVGKNPGFKNHGYYSSLSAFDNDGSQLYLMATYETEFWTFDDGAGDYIYYLTEDIANGWQRQVSEYEKIIRTAGTRADWYLNSTSTVDYYYFGNESSETLLGAKGANGNAWAHDIIEGEGGDDFIGGGGGRDILIGDSGNDEIRAGYGHDLLDGGIGSDILYGGGGGNIFESELDGYSDHLFIASDLRAHNHEWGRIHGGINADIITELDDNDRITILGTSNENLTFVPWEFGDYSGVGIFDDASLEALYIGNNLNTGELANIVDADPSRFW